MAHHRDALEQCRTAEIHRTRHDFEVNCLSELVKQRIGD
jgi:hypothetical protein